MSNCFVISPTIYPFHINVCIGTSEEAVTFFKSVEEDDQHTYIDEHIDGEYSAYTVRLLNGDVCIHFIENDENIVPKIVHEAFHATEFILERVNIPHSIQSSEAYAYYLQYIFTQIYNQLK